MKLTFDVQSSNRAMEANFAGRASAFQRGVQGLNRRRGARHYLRAYDATPKRTHLMADSLRFELTRQDMGYRLGWVAADFIRLGLFPYFLVVLFGSRTQAGNDYFSPIADEEQREYRREVAEIAARTVARGRRARGTR